ncbi:Gamma-interferon-inducible lysosomal thiol reductase, partial [Armadillidium nasatum]
VTTSDDGKGIEFECQNGPLECTGNKILSCVVEYFETDLQIKLLTCLMSSPSIQNAIKECGRKTGVPVSAVEECYTSGEGSLILYQNGLRTLKLDPELFFVPTVTVNK